MKLALIGYALLGLALYGGAVEWHGHHRGYDDGVEATKVDAHKQVVKAQNATTQAEAERDAANSTVANVLAKLDRARQELDTANLIAAQAMDARDALQQQLSAATAARDAALRKAAHDSPDCADLARLPVCPAVAGRLWPKAAGDPAHASH